MPQAQMRKLEKERRVDDAFAEYLAMGSERSLKRLADSLLKQWGYRSPSLSTLESWSRKYGWADQVREIDAEVRQESLRKLADWMVDERVADAREQVTLSRNLQRSLAAEYLNSVKKDEARKRGRTRLEILDPERVKLANQMLRDSFHTTGKVLGTQTDRLDVTSKDEKISFLDAVRSYQEKEELDDDAE